MRPSKGIGWMFLSALYIQSLLIAQSRVLSKAEAQELVTVGLGSRAKELPHFGLDDLPSKDPKEKDFYLFEASFSNPGGMQIVGHYAVHKITGAVWKLDICERVDSTALQKLQETIRRRIGVTPEKLKQLANALPCYDPN